MADVNRKLKEEIDYLSRLINSHKQETSKHPEESFTYQFRGSKDFRKSAAFGNFPCAGRSQIKTFSKTSLNRLAKNQNVKVNPYKIDRTMKNKSVFIKTQPTTTKYNYNSSLIRKVSSDAVQNKLMQCQNTFSDRSSSVLKSSVTTVPCSSFDTVKQTPVLVTACQNTKLASLVEENKNIPVGTATNKGIPNSLTVTKSIDKSLLITAKQKPSRYNFTANKFVYINKPLSTRLVKVPKNNSIVKTKYKVINSGKHQRFKNVCRNQSFRSNCMTGRHSYQNTCNYSLCRWKTASKGQWNVSRKSKCHNCNYHHSNWKNSYFGHYQRNVFKKRMMQRKRWKTHFTASHRKLNAGLHQIAKCTSRRQRMVTIGGLLYRASKMKLFRASKSSGKQITQNRMKLQTLLIRGIRYQMDPSRKTLRRVSIQPTKKGSPTSTHNQDLKRIDLGGSTYIQTQPGVLTKTESAQARTFVSRVVNRSIYRVLAATEKKSRSKNNLYCMFYNRFGRCNKGNQCPYKHDPDKIAVCVRFLRGTCKVVDCPFSHKVAPEKMPVCSFYLQGRCNNDTCPYRHVKVSRGAEICRDFLRGYCPAGQKCKKRHMLVCQEFTQKGSCKNRNKCPMHHPPRKGQKRKHSQCNISTEVSEQGISKQQSTQLVSELSSGDNTFSLTGTCSPLPSYIALEKDEKNCSPVKSPTVKGEALRIRPYFLSKGTLGVTVPVSQVSKCTK